MTCPPKELSDAFGAGFLLCFLFVVAFMLGRFLDKG